jgi:hypothetical protein
MPYESNGSAKLASATPSCIVTPNRRTGAHAEPFAGPEGGRSLRELQRELESLKSSLSVYLGSGLC